MVNVHRSGHVPTKKSAMVRFMIKVSRTLAQVTISCENENGKTVYNGCHSQFNDKDCEPLGLEQWTRRTGSCFVAHSRVSRDVVLSKTTRGNDAQLKSLSREN